LPIRLLRTETRGSDAALSVAVHWREPPNETHQVDWPGGRATAAGEAAKVYAWRDWND